MCSRYVNRAFPQFRPSAYTRMIYTWYSTMILVDNSLGYHGYLFCTRKQLCADARSSQTCLASHMKFKQCVRLATFWVSRYLKNSVMAASVPGALSVFRDLFVALTSSAENPFVFILRFACKMGNYPFKVTHQF